MEILLIIGMSLLCFGVGLLIGKLVSDFSHKADHSGGSHRPGNRDLFRKGYEHGIRVGIEQHQKHMMATLDQLNQTRLEVEARQEKIKQTLGLIEETKAQLEDREQAILAEEHYRNVTQAERALTMETTLFPSLYQSPEDTIVAQVPEEGEAK